MSKHTEKNVATYRPKWANNSIIIIISFEAYSELNRVKTENMICMVQSLYEFQWIRIYKFQSVCVFYEKFIRRKEIHSSSQSSRVPLSQLVIRKSQYNNFRLQQISNTNRQILQAELWKKRLTQWHIIFTFIWMYQHVSVVTMIHIWRLVYPWAPCPRESIKRMCLIVTDTKINWNIARN